MRLRPDVLFVESDPAVIDAIAPRLTADEHRVCVVTSRSAALGLRRKFAAGIIDTELEDGNGIELAIELLEARSIERAIFLAGASWQPVLRLAAQVGRVVGKDEGLDVLSAEVRRAVRGACATQSGIFGDFQDLVRPMSWPRRA